PSMPITVQSGHPPLILMQKSTFFSYHANLSSIKICRADCFSLKYLDMILRVRRLLTSKRRNGRKYARMLRNGIVLIIRQVRKTWKTMARIASFYTAKSMVFHDDWMIPAGKMAQTAWVRGYLWEPRTYPFGP
ncbi:MAG: hypothetical protein MSD82_04665, partial [Prevotella sp.]|nr:hypothetical protein [Prevotella sp.]